MQIGMGTGMGAATGTDLKESIRMGIDAGIKEQARIWIERELTQESGLKENHNKNMT